MRFGEIAKFRVGMELNAYNVVRLPLWERSPVLRAIVRHFRPEPFPHVWGPAHAAQVVTEIDHARRVVTYGDRWVRP